jgi:hypothetical protein
VKKYGKLEEVPDLVPSSLLIPAHRMDMRVPHLDEPTQESTTPIEAGYVLFGEPGWHGIYRKNLEIHAELGHGAEDFLDNFWMNHTGRVLVRVALDPDRAAPIDMYEAYKYECFNTAQYPSLNEEDYYKHFVTNWGVYERED